MVSNKKRLYVALYPSGVANNEELKFHWSFLIGPKAEDRKEVPGLRCHVKNDPVAGWAYEEAKIRNVKSTVSLLVRLLIAKVEDEQGLLRIFRETPVIQNDSSFRCRTWLADALMRISRAEPKVVGTSELDWTTVEHEARRYVEEKIAAGRYQESNRVLEPKPTWDMTVHKETIP